MYNNLIYITNKRGLDVRSYINNRSSNIIICFKSPIKGVSTMSDSNLWVKDRKKLFRELYHQYLEEGYENKEAKKLAKEEAEDMMAEYEEFAMSVANEEFGDD
jgi:hypothetical protein